MKGCPSCGQRFLGNEEFCPKDGATLVEMDGPEEDSLIDTTVDGRYTINKKIGEGGMGVVYLATHAVIGKKCALKVLRKELSGESEVAERFTQEARAAAAIGNEHIIEITDFGQLPDGSAYFVMEFLDGRSLHEDLQDGTKIDPKRTLHILSQCCDALAAAHSSSIVHRDLKPENIVLVEKRGDEDFVKILDFGIAKVARESGRLTRTGVIFGTPQYMSPEQAAGTNIDERTDVYSLGIIMYEMLCGHVPFEADTFMGVLTKHLYEEPIPPRRLMPPIDIPQSVEAVLLKSVAKKQEKRYQTMLEFGQDIRALAEGNTPQIVYSQMRDTARSTAPPVPPSEIVSSKKAKPVDDEELTIPGKNWRMLAGIGAAALVALVAVIAFVFGSGEENDATAQAKDLELDPAGLDTGQDSEEPSSAEASAPSEDSKVIALASEPSGASLYQRGALIGKLPMEIPRPTAENDGSKYAVKMKGYREKKIVITSTTPKALSIDLEPIAGSNAKKKSSRSRRKSRNKSRKEQTESSPKDKIQIRKKKKRTLGGDIADPWAN